jgi:hypothetical protein
MPQAAIIVLDKRAVGWQQCYDSLKADFGTPHTEFNKDDEPPAYVLGYGNPTFATMQGLLAFCWNMPHVARLSLEQSVDRERSAGHGDANVV